MKSESLHYKPVQEAIAHKPTIQEQIDYVHENRVGLEKVIENAPDIKKASRTIEMLRAIEENLRLLNIFKSDQPKKIN
jgi:hypothetical protein